VFPGGWYQRALWPIKLCLVEYLSQNEWMEYSIRINGERDTMGDWLTQLAWKNSHKNDVHAG